MQTLETDTQEVQKHNLDTIGNIYEANASGSQPQTIDHSADMPRPEPLGLQNRGLAS